MTKLNKKSDLYYINKIIEVPFINITKAHLIDDNCNEFTVTFNTLDLFVKTYMKPESLNKYIIDIQPFNRDEWNEMENEVDYARATFRK